MEMTKKSRLLKSFLENPESLSFGKIEKILLRLGFVRVGGKGSHFKYRNKELGLSCMVPLHYYDCKKKYKHAIAELIKNII